nr:hypothetical protein [Haladaptatus sp. R4]
MSSWSGAKTSGHHTQIVLEYLGGAIVRVNPDATAFRARNASFSFNIFPRWENPGEDAEHIAWAHSFYEAIVPYATESVAPNFLSDEGDSAFGWPTTKTTSAYRNTRTSMIPTTSSG